MSELFLPEFIWQTLTWSVLSVMLVVVARQHNTNYAKQAFGLFFSGLVVSYALSIFIGWRSALLSIATLYITFLVAFVVFAIGCYFLYEFFKRHAVAIKPEAIQAFAWISNQLKQRRPVWMFGLAGVLAGMLEPLQLSQYHLDQRYLLLEQTAPGHLSSLLYLVFATILPMILIVLVAGVVYWFLSRQQNNQHHNHYLLAGHSYIVISWFLLAVTAGFLRI